MTVLQTLCAVTSFFQDDCWKFCYHILVQQSLPHQKTGNITAFSQMSRDRKHTFSLDCWPLKMRPIGCPETSLNNYPHTLHAHKGRASASKPDYLTLNEGCTVRWNFVNYFQPTTCHNSKDWDVHNYRCKTWLYRLQKKIIIFEILDSHDCE